MDAINKRVSGRLYDKAKAVDDQTLSEILWVAWGKSASGKRTIPTARNQMNMKLYLLTTTGTWIYKPAENTLEKVNDKNLVPLVRGLIDDKALTKELGLTDGERAIIHQTVGWPEK